MREHDVLDEEGLATFKRLNNTRNLLAHELFSVVTGQVESAHEAKFDALVGLLHKIGVWWIVNFEIPINPYYDEQEINREGIVPGAILSLQMLIQVASGSTQLLENWRKGQTKG